MSTLSIIVLAAGGSSRMGTPKQLLSIGQTTFIEQVLEKARALQPDTLICVLGANAEKIEPYIPSEVELVHHSQWKRGLGSSIGAGIRYLEGQSGAQAIVILLADQPSIDPADLQKMVDLHASHPDKIIASYYEGSPGVPAIFPKEYWQELQQLDGDRGAKAILLKNSDRVILHHHSTNVRDIDTQEDYEQLSGQL